MIPIISVITVGMNHLSYIKELYKSLYQDYQPSVSFEAIYVDNCSSDGSVEFLRENYPQVKIIKNDIPKGFGENNNIGAFASTGKYLAIINPDVSFMEGSLDSLYEFMEKNQEVGIAVPRLFNKDLTHQYSIRGFITPKIFTLRIITNLTSRPINTSFCIYILPTPKPRKKDICHFFRNFIRMNNTFSLV